MEEYDGVVMLEEVLGAGGPAGASGEVVDEADGLVFERDGGATGGDESNFARGGGVAVDEFASEGFMWGERSGGWIESKVVVLFVGGA